MFGIHYTVLWVYFSWFNVLINDVSPNSPNTVLLTTTVLFRWRVLRTHQLSISLTQIVEAFNPQRNIPTTIKYITILYVQTNTKRFSSFNWVNTYYTANTLL